MTTPRSPHKDDDFRQLTGAFDRPMAPSPRFAEQLKARLEQESVGQQSNVISARPVSQRTARAGLEQPVGRRRWEDIAIAAALIVAMLGGSFWYADVHVGDGGPGVPESTRYAVQPLSSTPTSVGQTSPSSGPGNVNAWPEGFDPDVELEMNSLSEAISNPSYSVIAGDTIIVFARPAEPGLESAPGVMAIDLQTGAVKWVRSLTPKEEFVTDGKNIFGFFSEPGETDITLMAIEIEDGEFRWYGPTFDGGEQTDILAPIETMNLFGPTLVDQHLYFRTPEREIVAVDAETGEQQWSLASEETADADQTLPGSLVSDGQYLYEIDSERSLRKVSLEDGMVIERIEPDLEEGEYLNWIFATEQELLVVSKTRGSDPQHLQAVSLETGETLWRQPLGEVRPYITATSRVVAVPHYVPDSLVRALDGEIDDSGLYTSFLDLQSGEPVSLYGPSTGDFATLSSSGDVVCINEGMTVTCTDTASERRTLVTLPYAPGEGYYDPVMFHGDAAIIRGGERGLAIVQPKDGQPQQTTGPLPGDPGNTNAYPETIDLSQTYTADTFGEADLGANEMVVVGNNLVFVGGALTDPENLSIANPTLMSRDIATGEHNWTYQKPGAPAWTQQIVTDGEHLYANLYNPNVPMSYGLVSHDGATGDVRWEVEALHDLAGVEPSERYGPGEPVIVGDVVLVSYGPEILIALNRDTGEPIWTLAPGDGESAYPDEMYLPASPVVANANSAFRGLPDGSVEEIDLATGGVKSVILGPEGDTVALNMSLHLQGNSLAIKREMVPSDEEARITIDVHNIATDAGGWTISTSSYLDVKAVTPDTLVVTEYAPREPSLLERVLPFLDTPKPDVRVLAFDLASGDEVKLFEDGDVVFDLPPAISAAGNTVCVATETVRCVDREENEMVVEEYEVDGYMPQNAPVYWDGRIVIGNGMGPLTIAKAGS